MTALGIVLAILVALVLGLGTAAYVIYRPPFWPVIRNGVWMTNLKVGSADAGMYLRAHVALTGLFALNKTETIYYRARNDEDGDPLIAGRDYVIEGGDIPARWWALILYGEDNQLIRNESGRHSFNMGNLAREADGRYRIHLSRSRREGNWLPSGAPDQRLSFSLKVYNPDASVYQAPDKVALPTIRKARPQ